ncbi:MAG: antibiotic biosynthesis monooxygenase [Pseudomonadota bacterium]
MSYTFIARMKIFPEKEKLFIETCKRMEEAVAKYEPDTLYYKFYRLREPNAFAVIESFKTEAGDQAHQDSAHFKEIVPAMMECLDGGYEREFLDPLD